MYSNIETSYIFSWQYIINLHNLDYADFKEAGHIWINENTDLIDIALVDLLRAESSVTLALKTVKFPRAHYCHADSILDFEGSLRIWTEHNEISPCVLAS